MNGMKPNGNPTFRSMESTSWGSKRCSQAKRSRSGMTGLTTVNPGSSLWAYSAAGWSLSRILRPRRLSESFRFERRLRMKRPVTSRKSRTDWKRVDALKDDKIDFSDTPELTPEMFARGLVRRGLKPVARKKLLTLRIDSDVVEWYRRQGPGYQTRINALLRAYMRERKNA